MTGSSGSHVDGDDRMSVVAAVQRDLDDIRKRSPDLAESAIAATALALAREMDASNSATSKSMCARALVETMERLRELAPPRKESDRIDDVARKRAERRAAGGAGA